MPKTTVRPLTHEAIAAYGLARHLLALCSESRLVKERVAAELDQIGARIAAAVGCEVGDLTREKTK